MDRRAFIIIVGGGIITMPLAGEAQPVPKVPKIGLLSGASSAGVEVLVEAFKPGMQEHGYVEGKTFVLEARYGDNKSERLPELARELVDRKVDVIVRDHRWADCGSQTRDTYDPDRDGEQYRSGRNRVRGEPRAPGRECHRARAISRRISVASDWSC